jgi:hypothetical protein
VKTSSNKQGSSTQASWSTTMMNPISLHPGNQPQGCHRYFMSFLTKLKLVSKAMDVETWI